jgi:hypothetical protein
MWPGIGWVLGYSGCKLMAQQLTDIGLGRLRAFSGSSILPWCGKGGNQACLRLQTPSLWYAGTALNRSSNFEIVVVATVLWNHFLQMYKAHGSPRCNACGFPSIVTRVFQMLSVWDTSRLFFFWAEFLTKPGLWSTSRRLWSLTSCSKAIWDMAMEAKSPRRVCSHAHLEENDGLRKTVSFNKRRFDPSRLGWTWLMDVSTVDVLNLEKTRRILRICVFFFVKSRKPHFWLQLKTLSDFRRLVNSKRAILRFASEASSHLTCSECTSLLKRGSTRST